MRRSYRLFAALVISTLALLLVPFSSPVSGQSGQVTSAFATGTVLHADLLQNGATRLVDTEVAFSGAVYDTGGLDAAALNEMDRQFAPKLPAKWAFGRATGLEVGLAAAPNTENQVILSGKAEVSAPPNVGAVTNEIGPVDLDPLAWADLLRAEAFANTADTQCVIGTDASRGLAYAANAQLLDTASSGTGDELEAPVVALDAPDPARAVSQSRSRTVFVAQRARDGRLLGSDFGIMSEVRQTIAPVTLFGGTANELTIEFLGEWVLQAVATGERGGAYVHYGPGSVSPSTPVLRLIDAGGVEDLLTLQEILGNDGLVVDIPNVAEVAIGEPPRAIGGAAGSSPTQRADGTMAAAAVDVVRVRALPGAPVELTDLRVGHMEASTQVPLGGVSCSIPVTKTPSANSVDVGEEFTVTFTVTNPYECTLRNVRLHDVITTEGAARFEILSTDPRASQATAGSSLRSGTITWNDIGDMRPHARRSVTARIAARGGAGAILDTATANGTLADCADPGATVGGVNVGAVGTGIRGVSRQLRVPVVQTGVGAKFSEPLPRTGAGAVGSVVAGLLVIAAAASGMALNRRLR